MAVTPNAETGTVDVPDLGVTLRTILGAAAKCDPKRRVWKVTYKEVEIGSIRIKSSEKWEDRLPTVRKLRGASSVRS